jgi:O-antigen/teichoic acid export membrane protein
VIGQAPFVLATPLITRLFPAPELGLYGVALAFVGMIGPVAGLRLELAAISARSQDDARALSLLSVLAILPVTVASTALLCALKVLGVGSYGALSWALILLTGVLIAASGAYASLRCWLARQNRFRVIANSLTLQGCLRAGIPVLFASYGAVASLLLSSELASRLSAVWLMGRGNVLRAVRGASRVPLCSLRDCLQRFWKYPALLAPSALVDAAATMLPVPILATCYGLGPAGKFALVQRLVLLPAALIVSSVGDVFHAHAAREERGAAVARFVAATAWRILLLAIVVYVPFAAIAPFVSGWLFGEQWADAGPLITVLAPLCVAQTTVSPISRGLLLSGREERKFLADAVCLVLPITALYLLRRQPMIVAVACFSLSACVAYAIYYLVVVQALKNSPPLIPDGGPPRQA